MTDFDFYVDDEPIEKIQEIRRRPIDFITAPPDLPASMLRLVHFEPVNDSVDESEDIW